MLSRTKLDLINSYIVILQELTFINIEYRFSLFISKRTVTASSVILLLLLSRFSHVQFCATPETAAHQAPPSLGFSRQDHWSGLPFPSPIHENEK